MVLFSADESRKKNVNSSPPIPFCIHSDDLRTANIICDSEDGVTCLVIDRETFKQLISNLDEIRNKYNDESSLERKRYV